MREGLEIVQRKLLNVMNLLAKFAEKYKAMPCLAYTHLQPAQLTTVGKRATLWLNELYMDYLEVEHRMASLALLGSKGTTGTQASFMELFGGDSAKIKAVEMDIAHAVGFDKVVPVSGQSLFSQDGLLCGQHAERHCAVGQQVQLLTCACCKTSRRWRSPSKRARSVPRPCLTSGTPCGRSG